MAKQLNMMKLSKLMSFGLRHNPQALGLSPNSEGWVDLETLVAAIANRRDWQNITEADIRQVVETSDKQRYEIVGYKIRARYGHSRAARPEYESVVPPDILYHGTPRRNIAHIQRDGLKAMQRQYVHLSVTPDMALQVGHRRDEKPALLKIRAADAHAAGVVFGTPSGDTDNVYLVDALSPEFIDFP